MNIKELALKALKNPHNPYPETGAVGDIHCFDDEELERFAELVAAAEREACAKVCDEVGDRDCNNHAYDAATAIRARSNT